MTQTLIFDFGGVLVDDLSRETKLLKKISKLSPKLREQYWHIQQQSETGKANYSDLLRFRDNYLFPGTGVKKLEKYYLQTRVFPAWKLINKLKKNYKIIIFSNNHKRLPQKIARYVHIDLSPFPFMNSANYGVRKPDPRYYKILIKKFRLDPKTCVFVDDHEENLVPARKLGIKTFHYHKNYSQMLTFLKKQGIRLPK